MCGRKIIKNLTGLQKIGEWQKIGGSLTAKASRVGLYSKVKGEYRVEGEVFIGVCEWRETTKEEETLECGKFVSGDIKYGKLKEVGLPESENEIKPGIGNWRRRKGKN